MKNLLLLLVLLLEFQSFSQLPKIELGPEFSLDERSIPIEIISSDSSGYFIRYSEGARGGGESFIRFFDKDLNPTDIKVELIPENLTSNHSSLGTIELGDTLVQIILKHEKENWKYYKQIINLESKISSPYELIAEIDSEGENVINSFQGFLISENRENVVFFYSVPNEKSDNETLRVVSLDRTLSPRETEEYSLPFTNKQIVLRKVILSESGELIIFLKKYDDPSFLQTKEIKKEYSYQTYSLKEGEIRLLDELDPQSNYLRNIDLEIKGNEMIISGLYSKKDMYSAYGTFYLRKNISTKEVVKKFQTFTNKFFFQLEEKVSKSKLRKSAEGRYEDPYYVLDEIVIYNDTTFLIAEQLVNSTYSFISEDIAIIALDKQGNVIWTRKIGKLCAGDYRYISMLNFEKNGVLYFFYSDSKKNLNHKKGMVQGAFRYGADDECLMLSIVNKKGELERTCLSTREDLGGYRFRPGLSRWIDEKTLLIFTQDPMNVKNQRFIKLKF